MAQRSSKIKPIIANRLRNNAGNKPMNWQSGPDPIPNLRGRNPQWKSAQWPSAKWLGQRPVSLARTRDNHKLEQAREFLSLAPFRKQKDMVRADEIEQL